MNEPDAEIRQAALLGVGESLEANFFSTPDLEGRIFDSSGFCEETDLNFCLRYLAVGTLERENKALSLVIRLHQSKPFPRSCITETTGRKVGKKSGFQ